MNIRHPGQLKKWKSWGPFWSYQLNSTANPAHLPQNWAEFEVNGLEWQCCLAGSSKRAPRIFIFSIVLSAECLSYLKSIEPHARAFLTLIILSIGTVIDSWLVLLFPTYRTRSDRNTSLCISAVSDDHLASLSSLIVGSTAPSHCRNRA